MSDKPYYHEPNNTIHLRVWALGQMVWGAFLGGIFLAVVLGFLALVYVVGLFLPAESRETPDPNTWSSLMLPEGSETA